MCFKKTTEEVKRQPRKQEKILVKHVFDEVLVSRIYTELLRLDNEETNKEWSKNLNSDFSKDDQRSTAHGNRLKSLVIRGMQVKTRTVRP